MPEALMLQLLERLERWAGAAGTSLRRRAHWVPSSFVLSRRPEERALLAAAAELYDLIGATHDELVQRHADHVARIAAAAPGLCAAGGAV